MLPNEFDIQHDERSYPCPQAREIFPYHFEKVKSMILSEGRFVAGKIGIVEEINPERIVF
jgi:hypothetical protein